MSRYEKTFVKSSVYPTMPKSVFKLPSPASAFRQAIIGSSPVPDAPVPLPSPVEAAVDISTPLGAPAQLPIELAASAAGEAGKFLQQLSFDVLDPIEKFFNTLWDRLVFIGETIGGLGVFAIMLIIIGLVRNPQVVAFLAL